MHRRILDSYAASGDPPAADQHRANLRRIEELGAEPGELLAGESLGCNDWATLVKRLESGKSDGAVIFGLGRLMRDALTSVQLLDLTRAGFGLYGPDKTFDLINPQDNEAPGDAMASGGDYGPGNSAAVRLDHGRRRRGRPPMATYLCTGRDSPIRCGDCGHYLDINTNARGKTYADGVLRHHYRCLRTGGGCGKTIADWRVLDEIIEDIMLRWLADPHVLEMIRLNQEARHIERLPYLEEIAQREERKSSWGRLFNEGKISEAELSQMLDDLNAGIREAQARIGEIESAPISRLDESAVAEILHEWKTAPPAVKRSDLQRAWEGFHVLVDPGSSMDDKSKVWRRVHKPKRISVVAPPNGA
ncbi:zinc ribbon domain-containing protein [Streptomyces sp. OK228]|uniref:zinc ribbon domain-containing protein n=1 Tax=Streptomyces sp. OK228 TaxID=1882786 RepID=UPI000BDBE4F2|nr:zinc ribbon domain-containing protein [Streptomyces sp. OK228]SOE25584.1 hypothetical protein SAMN05442782_2326 [Streptomyces sp. OK228]